MSGEDPLQDLLMECLDRYESEGEAVIEELARQHPDQASAMRGRIEGLRKVGLLAGASTTEIPERLGEFRLLELLGGGGMGVVYLAEQEGLGRKVALKLIRPEQLYFPGARERFRREVEAIAQLQHPGIVPIHTVGEEGDVPFFAMECIEGCSLEQVLSELRGQDPGLLRGQDLQAAVLRLVHGDASAAEERESKSSDLFDGNYPDVCLRIARMVAEALEHAHNRGILHRDIKPSNIMVTPGGRVMLLDFGLAAAEGAHRLTRTGSTMGSLHYMSPEQAEGDLERVGPRSDLYSLGITLYELLTLQYAIERDTAQAVLRTILEGRIPPVRQRNPSVSWEAETVCMTATELEPARRYQSAADLARDLSNVLARRPIDARRAGLTLRVRRWSQRNPARSVALFLGLIVLLGGLIGYGLLERGARIRIEAKSRQAEANFQKALLAVERLLARVGDIDLRDVPQLEPVRRALLEDAVELFESFLDGDQDDPEVFHRTGATHVRLGGMQRMLGDSQAAEHSYRQGILILEHLVEREPGQRDYQYSLNYARSQQAILFRHLSRFDEALAAHEQNAAALRRWLITDPEDTESRTVLADCLYEMGNLNYTTGQYEPGEVSLRESVALLEGLVDSHRAEDLHVHMLGNSLRLLGDLLSDTGRAEQAESSYRLAIQRLSAAPANSRSTRQNRNNLAVCFQNLGILLSQQDRFPDAERAHQDAITAKRALVADFPETPSLKDSLAKSLINLGNNFLRQRDGDGAETYLLEARDILRRLVDRHPDDPRFHAGLANATQSLGSILVSRDQLEAALELFDEAIQEIARSLELQPANTAFLNSMEVFHYHKLNLLRVQERFDELARTAEEYLAHYSHTAASDLMGCEMLALCYSVSDAPEEQPQLDLLKTLVSALERSLELNHGANLAEFLGRLDEAGFPAQPFEELRRKVTPDE